MRNRSGGGIIAVAMGSLSHGNRMSPGVLRGPSGMAVAKETNARMVRIVLQGWLE